MSGRVVPGGGMPPLLPVIVPASVPPGGVSNCRFSRATLQTAPLLGSVVGFV